MGGVRGCRDDRDFRPAPPRGLRRAGHSVVTDGTPFPDRRSSGPPRFAPRGLAPDLPSAPLRLTCRGITVGWGVPAGATWGRPPAACPDGRGPGRSAARRLGPVPRPRAPATGGSARAVGPERSDPGGAIVDRRPLLARRPRSGSGARVVFDTTHGPVVLESGVEVRTGARLEGPLWWAPTRVCSAGPSACRPSARGATCVARCHVCVSATANKAHDGFVGTSVIGRWVNLGAGTITSDLKNTYGQVKLDPPGTSLDTGLQFLGSLIGDHAKTAIGHAARNGHHCGRGSQRVRRGRPPSTSRVAWGGAGRAHDQGRVSQDCRCGCCRGATFHWTTRLGPCSAGPRLCACLFCRRLLWLRIVHIAPVAPRGRRCPGQGLSPLNKFESTS